MDILQWLKGLSHAKCVFIGRGAAVSGLVTSGFATVAHSTCTTWDQHLSATYAIVGQVQLRHLILCSVPNVYFNGVGSLV